MKFAPSRARDRLRSRSCPSPSRERVRRDLRSPALPLVRLIGLPGARRLRVSLERVHASTLPPPQGSAPPCRSTPAFSFSTALAGAVDRSRGSYPPARSAVVPCARAVRGRGRRRPPAGLSWGRTSRAARRGSHVGRPFTARTEARPVPPSTRQSHSNRRGATRLILIVDMPSPAIATSGAPKQVSAIASRTPVLIRLHAESTVGNPLDRRRWRAAAARTPASSVSSPDYAARRSQHAERRHRPSRSSDRCPPAVSTPDGSAPSARRLPSA